MATEEIRLTRKRARQAQESLEFAEFVAQVCSSSAQREEGGNLADAVMASTNVDDTDDDDDQEYDPSMNPDVTSDEDDNNNFGYNDEVAGETPARRMTRQRADLENVTIEELEVRFAPPDLMPDMLYYDGDEDYENFLRDCFYRPLVENDEQPDESDPDFIPEAEMQALVSGPESDEEFRFDSSTMIPSSEVEDLINEIGADFGQRP